MDQAGPGGSMRHGRAAVLAFLFSAALAAGAAVLVASGPLARAHAIHDVTDAPLSILILAALFAAVDLAPVPVRVRGQVSLVVLNEVPLLLGLAMARPWALVLGRLLGDALVFGMARRQAPVKLAYNLASGAFAAAVAAIVYWALLNGRSPASPFGWLAGALSLAAAALLAHVTLRVVRRLYRQPRERLSGASALQSVLVLVASIGLAIVVLDAAWWEPWALVPLVLVGGLVVVAFRGYLRLTERFGALQQLYEFGTAVARTAPDSAAVSWGILDEVRNVMRTRRAELHILDGAEGTHRFVVEGEAHHRSLAPAPAEASVVRGVLDGGGCFRHSAGAYGRETRSDALLGEYRDVIAVPLAGGEWTRGALVALDRAEGAEPFDEDDERLFEALAAHAASTLERAHLIEELRIEADRHRYQATHDSLTGLANRQLFLERAAASLAETGRLAIALFDLDRFKEVNESLGHRTGDRLLFEVAQCLARTARERAVVARLGGDEFAIVVPGVIGPEETLGIVRDLAAALAVPFDLDGITLAVTASAGVTMAPEHGEDVATLLQNADVAMYAAKARGSGIELFSAAPDRTKDRLLLGGQLAAALRGEGQMSVRYQPIASFASREVVQIEALARWLHPEHGQVPADEFITLAERMGLVCQIRRFVLHESCRQAAEWRRAGYPIGLSVNLSGRDLADPTLAANVASELRENGLPAEALTLEVTETDLMTDLEEASRVLAELGKLGIRVAVDDFGTGYSSLAYLHRLPLDELKLDRSFISDMVHDEGDAIIVHSSIGMAHALGLVVVAEGVEDGVTCALLAGAGCDSLQGYYLARPMTPDDLDAWLATAPRLNVPEPPASPALRLVERRNQSLA